MGGKGYNHLIVEDQTFNIHVVVCLQQFGELVFIVRNRLNWEKEI